MCLYYGSPAGQFHLGCLKRWSKNLARGPLPAHKSLKSVPLSHTNTHTHQIRRTGSPSTLSKNLDKSFETPRRLSFCFALDSGVTTTQRCYMFSTPLQGASVASPPNTDIRESIFQIHSLHTLDWNCLENIPGLYCDVLRVSAAAASGSSSRSFPDNINVGLVMRLWFRFIIRVSFTSTFTSSTFV